MRISDWSSDVCSSDLDWSSVRLVVFDVDGTLYRQRPLRLRMAAALVADGLRRRSLSTIRALGAYRRLREELADNGTRSEEHTSELQSLMRISYADFSLKNHTLEYIHRLTRILSINKNIDQQQ